MHRPQYSPKHGIRGVFHILGTETPPGDAMMLARHQLSRTPMALGRGVRFPDLPRSQPNSPGERE
jgi:hypothetical protein